MKISFVVPKNKSLFWDKGMTAHPHLGIAYLSAFLKDKVVEVFVFDETFVGLVEYNEPDVSFKMTKLGYKIIFNPKAKVSHLPSREGFFKERPSSYGRVLNF